MKTIIIILTLIFPLLTVAQPADFNAYKISPCSYWMQNSGGGYVCQNMPLSIVVPEAYSIAEVIKELRQRVTELEKKNVEIEALCKKP